MNWLFVQFCVLSVVIRRSEPQLCSIVSFGGQTHPSPYSFLQSTHFCWRKKKQVSILTYIRHTNICYIHDNILVAFHANVHKSVLWMHTQKYQPSVRLSKPADGKFVHLSGPHGNISWRFFWYSELLSMTMRCWFFLPCWCTCLAIPKCQLNTQSFYATCTLTFNRILVSSFMNCKSFSIPLLCCPADHQHSTAQ